nr:sensor domain-containing diguanylate cyclase [Novosphingobium sp. 9]
MPITITDQETSALYGMLAEGGPDIILKIDASGHIVESSPALARLVGQSGAANGIETLPDLVEPSHLARVATALAEAIAGRESGWVEFPAVTTDARESWFEIRCRALHRNDGKAWGALAILRSVDERRALRDQLFAATYSDALTGLSNRRAFVSMLEHMLTRGIEGCVALFGIDFFKAINMRYGQARGTMCSARSPISCARPCARKT